MQSIWFFSVFYTVAAVAIVVMLFSYQICCRLFSLVFMRNNYNELNISIVNK